MKKLTKTILITILFTSIFVGPFLLYTHTSQADKEIEWGVNFSESQANYLGLDPKETYSAIIHELGAKRIKIHVNWNATQPTRSSHNFESLDTQINEAEANDVKLILVIGMKTGRWPECHTPDWLSSIAVFDRNQAVVDHVSAIVERYKDSPAIEYWQIENEPFLEFGTCPDWYYAQGTALVEAEIQAVRAIDPTQDIIVSESGELSDWTTAASLADIVGVTMYRSSWNKAEKTFGINPYSFLVPEFYSAKAAFIKHYYKKPVISIELQAEPWTAKHLMASTLEVQAQSMNLDLFKENIEFAKQANLPMYYFWGAEWWYWMKTEHNQPEIWNHATGVFLENKGSASGL